ncbi:MAG: hypothetical protein K8T90_11280 [Planctomycetes bacterium]|nr:hypothetical protein [Planctomycetota bacterium]
MAGELPGSDDLSTFEASGLVWRAEAAHAALVQREIAEKIDALDRIAGVELIKRNLVRAVWRVPLSDGRRVIVKRYRVAGVGDFMKYAVRDSRALTEWRVGRGLDAAGIATAVPLAWAERRIRGVLRDAALVTREIPDAVHLNAFVERHLLASGTDSLRASFYDDLARLVRRMHDAGFVHNDFHGGNLLVVGSPAAPRIHVIDLHSVARHGRPPEAARWFDLVKLLHSMLTCSTVAERRRICEVYESGAGTSGTRIGRLLAAGRLSAELEPELERMERKRVRSRTDRSLGRSSKFDVSTLDGLRVHHLRTVDPAAVVALLGPHRRDVAARARNVLKDGRRSALTTQVLATPAGPRPVVVKEYRGGGIVDRAKNVVRMPRAMSAWVAGNGLLVRGFDAAEPLALALTGRGPSLGSAWVVMEDLGDGARADLVVLARFAGDIGAAVRAEKAAFVAAAADLVRRLHASGVYHADLKAVNVFVRGGATPRFVLADYDRVEFDRPLSERRRVKNLAQLSASVPVCVTLTDRLRFFRVYAASEPAVAADWKRWFRRIVAAQSRKIVVRTRPIE